MSRTRIPYPSAQPVYAAAARWRDRCLLDDRSLFADSEGSSVADAQVLVRDFVNQPDVGSDDFLTKLSRQLSQSPASAVQLAAELLYVHFLIARSDTVSGNRKREIVRRVLSFTAGTADMPDDLADALESGLVRAGQAFNSYRWRQFGYLIQVVEFLERLSPTDRRQALGDADRFLTVLDELDDQGAAIQRYALEHLLFPDVFPPVVSREHRAEILRRWPELAGPVDAPESIRLRQVAQGLGGDANEHVDFYGSLYWWEWSAPPPRWQAFAPWATRIARSVDLDDEERDYKLAAAQRVRDARDALEAGSADWPQLLRTSFTKDNNLVGWRVHQPFTDWVSAKAEAAAGALRELWRQPGMSSVDLFLDRVPDAAAHGTGARLSIASFLLGGADATALPPWRANSASTAYRLTNFWKPEPTATDGERYATFLDFLDLVSDIGHRHGIPVRDRLDAQGLAWAVVNYDPPEDWSTAEREALISWRSGKGTAPPAAPQLAAARDDQGGAEESDRDLADLARDLHLDEPFLDEIVQLLGDKGQLIFYGPPGTGKTYVARELAKWLAGDTARVRLVQFHPSYAYEDFIEGLRPRPDQSGFHLVDGPLVEMARAAAEDTGHDYVLVVDELNRGNVARVFGELYFLLEYRNEPARLLYSREEFRLPPNLHIIATMNTADRTIALLDTALRRRFYFVPFQPDELPISQVLDTYLARHHPGMRWVAAVVRRANELLADPAAAIGPSHFMRDDLDETWVRRAWQHSVIPTLEEHFYGQQHRLGEFDLDRLRADLDAPGDDTPAS